MIKLQWIASIWCRNYPECWVTSQKIQKNAKLQSDQITMNCIDLMSKRLKQRKITNAIKLWSICIDLTSKLSKMLSYVSKNSKERKTTKLIKDKKNVELRRKTFKTTQNYKTDQITMNCIDLMSKWTKNDKLQTQSNN